MGHNVGKAAELSVKKGQIKKVVERTDEQIFRDIRNNLASRLATTPDDARFLLRKYDEVVAERVLDLKRVDELLAELNYIKTGEAASGDGQAQSS